jgi:glycosyltransferase involved in cell wall biosynthesis
MGVLRVGRPEPRKPERRTHVLSRHTYRHGTVPMAAAWTEQRLMRVLIASAWEPTSGVLSVYRLLAKHLGERDVQYSAFAFDGWRADTRWKFCDELIDGRSATLSAALIDGTYDLLHCVDTAYSPPYGVEVWARRARFAGSIVLMAQQAARRELTEPAHATRYVACSQAAADVLALDASGRVTVIHNGYDEDVFQPGKAATRRPTLMWVGRSDDPQKGVELYLEALEALPEFDGIFVDAGPDSDVIARRVSRLGGRVRHVRGLQPHEMAVSYRETALSGGAFLSTSRHEGFLIAAVEAMACGCPVIAPRLDGLAHLTDGRNALIYDRAAGVEGIAHALRRLDRKARTALVASARREAELRWTSRAMAEAYFSLYTDALASSPADRGHCLRDKTVRTGWKIALRARPAWQRMRARG